MTTAIIPCASAAAVGTVRDTGVCQEAVTYQRARLLGLPGRAGPVGFSGKTQVPERVLSEAPDIVCGMTTISPQGRTELLRPDGSPVRVLVVDDEQSITELLSMALRYE